MNIQNYVLPEWEKEIKNRELPDQIQEKFNIYGKSMAEYLDRFMMRSLPENWYRGWTRYKFPLDTHSLVLDIHEVVARNFGDYVKKYRAGEKETFNLESEEIEKIQQLENQHQSELDKDAEKLTELRHEISKLRKTRTKERVKPKRKTTKKSKKKVTKKVEPKVEEEVTVEEVKEPQTSGNIPERKEIYDKWMEMVESKPISKSYWHIHEYLSRYILDFAEEHTDNGIVTKEVIDDFLEDYGKGKRPKTMNHYNRVVYRFWEFYDSFVNPEGNEMEVW